MKTLEDSDGDKVGLAVCLVFLVVQQLSKDYVKVCMSAFFMDEIVASSS